MLFNKREVQTLTKWFRENIKDNGKVYTLDKDQAKIVLDSHKNVLVTARAGSGKTRTIVAKVSYLITHEKIDPREILVFSFNRKARMEVNERLAKISYRDKLIFDEIPAVATTFHAFAYNMLGGKDSIGDKIISEAEENKILADILKSKKTDADTLITMKEIESVKQFITRAEQQFFKDYHQLDQKIEQLESEDMKQVLHFLKEVMDEYHTGLRKMSKINFNIMISQAAHDLGKSCSDETVKNIKYIFVDEYQDFSLLFLEMIWALRKNCPKSKLLAVGDDWQAINRFAGSNVEYFQHFEKYFTEDEAKLFIPTNYRSGKRIVGNANYFMGRSLKDYNGCMSGNKIKAQVSIVDINKIKILDHDTLPLKLKQIFLICEMIVKENQGKTIKILHRNNNLSFKDWSLERFFNVLCEKMEQKGFSTKDLSFSTIHKSKGLEADVVVLLEIDAKKFPSVDKTGELYEVFGENARIRLEDEFRLFYVAITRPKEKLYILTSTPKSKKEDRKYNFLSYLDEDKCQWLPYSQ